MRVSQRELFRVAGSALPFNRPVGRGGVFLEADDDAQANPEHASREEGRGRGLGFGV